MFNTGKQVRVAGWGGENAPDRLNNKGTDTQSNDKKTTKQQQQHRERERERERERWRRISLASRPLTGCTPKVQQKNEWKTIKYRTPTKSNYPIENESIGEINEWVRRLNWSIWDPNGLSKRGSGLWPWVWNSVISVISSRPEEIGAQDVGGDKRGCGCVGQVVHLWEPPTPLPPLTLQWGTNGAIAGHPSVLLWPSSILFLSGMRKHTHTHTNTTEKKKNNDTLNNK